MEAFVQHLRDEHRIKLFSDYAYIRKCGDIAIIAPKVWLAVLREHEGLLAGLNVQWIEVVVP